MKRLKKVTDVIYWILIILISFTIITSVVVRALNEQSGTKPNMFGYTPTVVVSGSMMPTIQINSLNIIKKCDTSEIDDGDIIVYWSDHMKMNILHRVIGIETVDGERQLLVKGDANESPDNVLVTDDNIIGKVVYIGNWAKGFLDKVMYPNGSGINYSNLVVYSLAVVIGAWIVLSIIYCALYLTYSFVKRHIFGIKDEEEMGDGLQ